MNIFNYAVWFIPEEDSEWYHYTNGFIPHMTIKAYLTYKEAVELYNNVIKDVKDTTVYLNDFVYSNESGFSALYYNISTDTIYNWWPKDAHISFRYSYNDFTEDEIKDFKNINIPKKSILSNVKIVNCNGYFKDWYKKSD